MPRNSDRFKPTRQKNPNDQPITMSPEEYALRLTLWNGKKKSECTAVELKVMRMRGYYRNKFWRTYYGPKQRKKKSANKVLDKTDQ